MGKSLKTFASEGSKWSEQKVEGRSRQAFPCAENIRGKQNKVHHAEEQGWRGREDSM
jgi:hypothetical protein